MGLESTDVGKIESSPLYRPHTGLFEGLIETMGSPIKVEMVREKDRAKRRICFYSSALLDRITGLIPLFSGIDPLV
jgi:hypothetical protein